VRFGNDDEKGQAMTEMNGKYCSTRAMRIGPATPRKSSGLQYFRDFEVFFLAFYLCRNQYCQFIIFWY
jgi:hypothetical protein